MMESDKQFTRCGKAKLAKSKSNRARKRSDKKKKKVATISHWRWIADIIGTFLAKVLAEVAKAMLGL
jgi:hypothetical protein